jgi:hypothetical protein
MAMSCILLLCHLVGSQWTAQDLKDCWSKIIKTKRVIHVNMWVTWVSFRTESKVSCVCSAGFQGKDKRVTDKVLLTAFELLKDSGARVIQTPKWVNVVYSSHGICCSWVNVVYSSHGICCSTESALQAKNCCAEATGASHVCPPVPPPLQFPSSVASARHNRAFSTDGQFGLLGILHN